MCHGVLYRQLAGWMLHGLLLDNYGEFFVQKVEVDLPVDDVQPDSETRSTQEHEQDLGLVGGVTARQLNRALVTFTYICSNRYVIICITHILFM